MYSWRIFIVFWMLFKLFFVVFFRTFFLHIEIFCLVHFLTTKKKDLLEISSMNLLLSPKVSFKAINHINKIAISIVLFECVRNRPLRSQLKTNPKSLNYQDVKQKKRKINHFLLSSHLVGNRIWRQKWTINFNQKISFT